MEFTVAIKVSGEVMTLDHSFAFGKCSQCFIASSPAMIAEVPEFMAIQYFVPTYLAQSDSNCFTCGPSDSQLESSTRFIADFSASLILTSPTLTSLIFISFSKNLLKRITLENNLKVSIFH